MKAESEPLSTADLAQAGSQSPPEPRSDHPRVNILSNPGVLEPERERNPPPRGEERKASEPFATPPAAASRNTPGTGGGPGTVSSGGTTSAAATDAATALLFEKKEAEELRARWNDIQVGFVDEPRTAVERADNLVAETIKRLAESFAASRQKLEREWGQGGNATTETLRLSLQRYRSFFNRLLSI